MTPIPSPPDEDQPSIAQAAFVFRHILDHIIEGGTFRFLIYDRLGFGSDAYEPLYRAGGMEISNYIEEQSHPSPAADVVTENMRERVRAAIGSVDVQEEDSDNLAVALCTYFSDHLDRPECDYAAEKENDETGWGPWVIERCDVAISRITNAAITAALAERSKTS